SGAVGASVTIAGTNFGATKGASVVKFNGTTATVTTWSATSIAVTVPAGATTGEVTVTGGGGASNGGGFTISASPNLTSVSPSKGIVGTVVTVSGSNFGASQGSSSVKFNGVAAIPTSWSATNITAPVPAGTTSGNVVVTVAGSSSNGMMFSMDQPPVVT